MKTALSIPASATDNHVLLDAAAESISRLIDNHLGFHVYPSSETRHYTAKHTNCLYLDAPLLSVDAIQTTSDGSNFGTTFATDGYYLAPYNAALESPPKPYHTIEVNENTATAVFNTVQRGVRISGTWGHYNQYRSTSAVLTNATTSGATTFGVTNATALSAGMTLRLENGTSIEQVFVTRTPVSATGAHTSTIDVLRGQNGTTNITPAANTTVHIYEYPIVQGAALFQAEMDYRAKDAPLGFSGGEPFGTQRVTAPGGLHPFTQRMLDPIRIVVTA